MSRATDRLCIAVMAMSDVEQHALAAALDHNAGRHDEPHMRAFYAALCAVVEESAAVAKVRTSSLPTIVDPFDELTVGEL